MAPRLALPTAGPTPPALLTPGLGSQPGAQGSRRARLWPWSLEGRRHGCLSPRSMVDSSGGGLSCQQDLSLAQDVFPVPLLRPASPPPTLHSQHCLLTVLSFQNPTGSPLSATPPPPSRPRRECPRESERYCSLLKTLSLAESKQSPALCVWHSQGWGWGVGGLGVGGVEDEVGAAAAGLMEQGFAQEPAMPRVSSNLSFGKETLKIRGWR